MREWNSGDRIAIGFAVAAVFFLISGGAIPIGRRALEISPIAPLDAAEMPLSGIGFKAGSVYPSTPLPPYRDRGAPITFYGSWLGSGDSTGAVHTRWYHAVPHFAIYFSGYLNTPGDSLCVEVSTEDTRIVRLPLAAEFVPAESWWVKEISLAGVARPVKFRLAAIDQSRSSQGWLGFSDPFVIRHVDALQAGRQMLLVLLTAGASFFIFLAPGLLLRYWRPKLSFIWVPIVGVLLAAALGLISWIGPQASKPRWISRAGLALIVGITVYGLVRFRLSRLTTAIERRVLAIAVLIGFLAIAKSVYSLGPEGELYAGRISRTLEPGARSDSRVSYHTVQLVALRESAKSSLAAELYYPWDFSSRGPLAGLAVSPIVLSSPVQISSTMPDAPWQLFDPQGFTAFRIAMVALACCALTTVFGLAAILLPLDWAFLAFLIAATSPFIIHEVYFTWPKLFAAGFTLQAAYLVFRSRFLLSGFVLGLGYLSHPSALLWFPALVGIIFLLTKPQFSNSAIRIAASSSGLAIVLLLWFFLNRGHFTQNYFLTYVGMTSTYTPSPEHWVQSRMESLLNTIVPFYFFVFHRNSPEIASIYRPSPPWIQFMFQYWNTLPFAVGLGFFFCYFLRAIWIAARKRAAWLWLVFGVPLLLFVMYFGPSTAGLARDGLHAWILGLLIFCVAIWYRFPPASNAFWRAANLALFARGAEILVVLLLSTVVSNPTLAQRQFQLSDVFSLLFMLAGTLFLCVYLFLYAERMRCRTLSQAVLRCTPLQAH